MNHFYDCGSFFGCSECHAVDVCHGSAETVRGTVGKIAVFIDAGSHTGVGDLQKNSHAAGGEEDGFLDDTLNMHGIEVLAETVKCRIRDHGEGSFFVEITICGSVRRNRVVDCFLTQDGGLGSVCTGHDCGLVCLKE